jgi:nucleotide sugar dehydrogenase
LVIKIRKNKRISVIGQGYVGLPLSRELTKHFTHVVGIDVDEGKTRDLNQGISHISDVPSSDLETMLARGYIASSDYSSIPESDVVVICVPTPLMGNDYEPDLSFLQQAAEGVIDIKKGGLIVLESTSFPGTTEELFLPVLESSGKNIDRDFFLAFSPERVDPGNKEHNIKNTPRILGGVSPASAGVAADFYKTFVDDVVVLSGAKEAEMAKLIENTYRLVNISLSNELLALGNSMNLDFWEALRGASTKPFGFQRFSPGPGVGGHCIPVDPLYLMYKAQVSGAQRPEIISAALEVQSGIAPQIVSRIGELTKEESGSGLRPKILLLGMSYKANSADTRQSPGVKIIQMLLDQGFEANYYDPHVQNLKAGGLLMDSIGIDGEVRFEDWDLVVLLQEHSCYDYDAISSRARRILDTRGVFSSANSARF